MSRRRIVGAHVLTMDPHLGDIPNGEILVGESGRIEHVGPARPDAEPGLASDTASDGVVDARGMIAIPGFVDTHRHVWVTLFRGMTSDMTVQGYRQYTKSVVAERVRPEDVFAATLLGALEAIDGGTTTLTDVAHITKTPEHTDASVDALQASGVRGVYAHTPPNGVDNEGWWSHSELTHPADIVRLANERLADPDARVTLAMGMRPVHFLAPGTVSRDVEIGRSLGLQMIFDGIGAAMGEPSRWSKPGYLTATELADLGVLGPDITFVHCNHVPTSELEQIARHGAHLSIAPEVEMLCGYGLPVLDRAVSAGIRPALSSDISSHGVSDMFTLMKAVLAASRGRIASDAYDAGGDIGPWTVTTRDVLEFATMSGARFLGMDDRIGSITPGKQADIVLFARDQLNLTPLNDAAASVALFAHPGNIDTVMIGGEIVKQGGRLTSSLVQSAIEQVTASRDFVVGNDRPPATLAAESTWRF